MLETPRRWLAALRAGADPQRFAYHEVPDPDDPETTCCANAEDRAQLLLALQYDPRPEDAPLLRLLLDAEIEAHSHADYQGLEEELHLAAWLVAKLRDPADVFRMSRAKFANFDTGCGFDGEHLVAAGVARTLAYLHASDDPRGADVFEYLAAADSECKFDEAEIDAWHAAKAEWFPAREADESPLTMLERALRFAPAEAPRWLELWLAGQEPGDRTLSHLCSYAVRLGDFDRAIAVTNQRIALAGDADSGVDIRETLVGVLIGAGRIEQAEATMEQAALRAAQQVRSAWEQRRTLERWLELAEAATSHETAGPLGRRAFERADALFTAGFGHCYDNLERLAACAEAFGASNAYLRLAAARDEERRRLDEQMARLTAR